MLSRLPAKVQFSAWKACIDSPQKKIHYYISKAIFIPRKFCAWYKVLPWKCCYVRRIPPDLKPCVYQVGVASGNSSTREYAWEQYRSDTTGENLLWLASLAGTTEPWLLCRYFTQVISPLSLAWFHNPSINRFPHKNKHSESLRIFTWFFLLCHSLDPCYILYGKTYGKCLVFEIFSPMISCKFIQIHDFIRILTCKSVFC